VKFHSPVPWERGQGVRELAAEKKYFFFCFALRRSPAQEEHSDELLG